MQDRQSTQTQQDRENLQQNANPETLSVSDETQRTKGGQADQNQQQLPTGNEEDIPDTQGSEAGMGE